MIVAAGYDSPEVRGLLAGLAAHYVDTYGAHDLDGDDPADYAPPAGGCLLGVDGGQPVAVACWRRYDATACELRRFYVVPVARGRGVARRLLVAALDRARADGYTQAVCATVARDGLAGLDVRPVAPFGPYTDLAGVGCYEVRLPEHGALRSGPSRRARTARNTSCDVMVP